jgi:hypothetical protein
MPTRMYKGLKFQPFWTISSGDITSFMRCTYKKSPCRISPNHHKLTITDRLVQLYIIDTGQELKYRYL